MPENEQLSQDFAQLARIALAGRPQDIQLLIHRASKKYRNEFPSMTEELVSLLKEAPSRSSPLRKQQDAPLPVDIDSRLQLLKIETDRPQLEPILSRANGDLLKQVISEQQNFSALSKLGLDPTKSMLFTGPPGVGKTLAAKWVATQLDRQLVVLDLAAVMSSFLGRTGNNIRFVLDYAKNRECVLLIDELDAIAKRRDDNSEIGELKRLVTVLLQEIDDWPATGLLIAATNHPDLLDPAIWRRFEVVMYFDKPDREQTAAMVKRLFHGYINDLDQWSQIFSYLFSGKSYSEIERQITLIRKHVAMTGKPINEAILSVMTANQDLKRSERLALAMLLDQSGLISQRAAHELSGVSRDTIRKYRDAVVHSTIEKEGKTSVTKKISLSAANLKKKKNNHGKT